MISWFWPGEIFHGSHLSIKEMWMTAVTEFKVFILWTPASEVMGDNLALFADVCRRIVSSFGLLLLWPNTMTKRGLSRKGFIWLTLPHCSQNWRKSGQQLKPCRNLDAGANAEAMGESSSLSCFLLEAKTTCPGMALPTMACPDPLIPIYQWLRKSLVIKKCLESDLMKVIFSIDVPPSLVVSGLLHLPGHQTNHTVQFFVSLCLQLIYANCT